MDIYFQSTHILLSVDNIQDTLSQMSRISDETE